MRLKTIQEWREAVHNPPKCCLNCDNYLAHAGEWEESASCKEFNANPPREFVEVANECQAWLDLIPF